MHYIAMSESELHQLIVRPPRRELRALLVDELAADEVCEEGGGIAGSAVYEPLRHAEVPYQRTLKYSFSLVFAYLVLVAVVRVASTIRVTNTREGLSSQGPVQFASLSEDIDCRTARQGERCYADVTWAMRNRDEHPEWYIGLNKCSDFYDFQNFMHSQVLNSGARRCPKPCASHRTPPKGRGCKVKKSKGNCHTAVPGDNCYAHMIYTKSEAMKYPHWYPGVSIESSLQDVQYYLHTERVCPMPCMNSTLKKEDNITGCHTALPGDTCFADILLAKNQFIEKHPSWYPGMTNSSSNDRFQAFFHAQKHEGAAAEQKACPAPCNKTAMDEVEMRATCKTAAMGDACYESVLWGATIGVETHPDWYDGLIASSPFEEFQAYLHKDNHSKCHHVPCPCQKPAKGDACYKTVMWVISDGLDAHPDRFKGLTKRSSFQEVQQHLHKLRTSACGRPCKTFDEDNRSPWRQTRSWL